MRMPQGCGATEKHLRLDAGATATGPRLGPNPIDWRTDRGLRSAGRSNAPGALTNHHRHRAGALRGSYSSRVAPGTPNLGAGVLPTRPCAVLQTPVPHGRGDSPRQDRGDARTRNASTGSPRPTWGLQKYSTVKRGRITPRSPDARGFCPVVPARGNRDVPSRRDSPRRNTRRRFVPVPHIATSGVPRYVT